MGSTKYLTSVGELSRRDNSLCFKKDGTIIHLPVNEIREIYCMSSVKISSDTLSFLGKMGIMVHFFDYYQNYSGSFYPKDRYMSGKVLLRQVQAYEGQRLFLAKKFVLAIGTNIQYVLHHYYKHGVMDVKDLLHWIKTDFVSLVQQSESVPVLMSVEGDLWNRFYQTFSSFVQSEFVFDKRVRRPPDNPMNALISFGNSLLYSKCVSVIYETHLDQRVSFLHELAESRYSLSLDVSEIFKPVLVFRTIFDLVNRKQLQVDKHFRQDLNCCLLNEEGRNLFITAFEKRLDTTFYHKKLKRKVSYRTAIKLDCYKLLRYIMEQENFAFFSLYEMM